MFAHKRIWTSIYSTRPYMFRSNSHYSFWKYICRPNPIICNEEKRKNAVPQRAYAAIKSHTVYVQACRMWHFPSSVLSYARVLAAILHTGARHIDMTNNVSMYSYILANDVSALRVSSIWLRICGKEKTKKKHKCDDECCNSKCRLHIHMCRSVYIVFRVVCAYVCVYAVE